MDTQREGVSARNLGVLLTEPRPFQPCKKPSLSVLYTNDLGEKIYKTAHKKRTVKLEVLYGAHNVWQSLETPQFFSGSETLDIEEIMDPNVKNFVFALNQSIVRLLL